MKFIVIPDELIAYIPANTRRSPNVGLLLAHRLRRWPNINPTLGERLVFAGIFTSLTFTADLNQIIIINSQAM